MAVSSKHHANRYNAELYERIRVLGKGSFGTAIVHRRHVDGALVVLKEIDLRKLKQDADKLAMVIQEARIMSKLSHPNIIQYYNAYTRDNSKLVIEMEYARIGTLQTYLSLQTRPLDELEVLAIFRQILAGLEYLHSKSIVHLDLKMANIFVTSEGSVKIGDFGIARLMSRPQDDQQQHQRQVQDGGGGGGEQTARPRLASVGARTASGAPAAAAAAATAAPADESQHYCQLGTLAYSSPERCMGGPTGFKSDIWSLGCLLYELVELKPLFPAMSLAELVMSITQVRFEPMRRADIQSGLRNLFLLMIARQPNDRPAASELVYITDNLLLRHQQRRQATTTTTRQHYLRPEVDARTRQQPPVPAPPMQLPPATTQTLSYPHSIVYQVRLSSRNVQVDRVNLPQSKRVKEMVKGRSHYLVLTYDNIVYGWGTRHCGQLGACGAGAPEAGHLLCAGSRPSARRSPGTRHTRSARNSLTARDLQLFARSGDLQTAPGTPTTTWSGGGHLSLTQPPSLASSTQTLIVGRQPSTPPLLLAGGHTRDWPRQLAETPPTTRPFILSELNKRKIVRVAAGNDFSVFLSKTGIVMTCGDGSRGCLGRGELASSQTPCMVDALLSMDVVGVACGPEHVVAVCGNGQAFAWGNSRHGRLGLAPERLLVGSEQSRPYLRRNHLVVVPQLVEFSQPNVLIKNVFCGDKCTVFLDSQNNCWACGENTNNRLGLDVRRRFKRTLLVQRFWQPAQILSLASSGKCKIVSCELAANHATYLTSEGKLLVLGQDIDRSYKLRSDLASTSPSRPSKSSRRQKLLSFNGSELYLTNRSFSELRQPLRKLIDRLLANNLLSNFKISTRDKRVESSKRDGSFNNTLTRQQRRAIELYLKSARSCKIMPFDCVLRTSCTRKFTLALTNDNRVYFWGARTHDNDDGDEQNRLHLASGKSSSFRILRQAPPVSICNKKPQSIEPQLATKAANSLDENFIKIGATNESLMSSIQSIGSDQPILHARNPQLRAASLNDLWILDYKPGGGGGGGSSGCSLNSSCSCSPNSSLSSLSCSSCCYSSHICDYDSDAISQCNLIASGQSSSSDGCCQSRQGSTQRARKRHDAILEPQPIDRFFLVLDTTVKLASPSALSRPTSRRGSLSLKQLSSPAAVVASGTAAGASPGQIYHSFATDFVDVQRGKSGAQQAKTLTSPRLNIVEESRSSGDLQRQQQTVAVPTTAELDDKSQLQGQEAKLNSERTLDCCRSVAADADREQRRDQGHLFGVAEDNLKIELSNSGPTGTSVTPPSVSAHTGLSLEEPRSISTFAPNFNGGRHLIVGARSIGHLEQDEHDEGEEEEGGRPMMRKLSFERSSQLHAFGPSYLLRRRRGAKSGSRPGRRRARKGRALEPPESTAVTLDADDTSSMPTWVRNEYLQQLSSGPSSPEHHGKLHQSRSISQDRSDTSCSKSSIEIDDQEQQVDNEEEEEEEKGETCVGANELETASIISAELTLTYHAHAAIQANSTSSHSEFSISTAIGVEHRTVARGVEVDRTPLNGNGSGHCSSASSQVKFMVRQDGNGSELNEDKDEGVERARSRSSGASVKRAANNHTSHLCRSQSNISTANKWFQLYLAEDLARTSDQLDKSQTGEIVEEQWRIAENLLECNVYKSATQPAVSDDKISSSSAMSLSQDENELHDQIDITQHNNHDQLQAVVKRGPNQEVEYGDEEQANRDNSTGHTEFRRAHLLQQRALSQSTSCLPIERYTRLDGDLTGDSISHALNNYHPPVDVTHQRRSRAKTGSRSSLSSIRKSLVRIFC